MVRTPGNDDMTWDARSGYIIARFDEVGVVQTQLTTARSGGVGRGATW